MNDLFNPTKLERWSFMWSEARLLIAAVALFIGGVPPIVFIAPSLAMVGILKLAWLISGAASLYLLYRWVKNGQRVFGSKETKDSLAFLVMNISGLNLGITGLLGTNIGMSISSNQTVFVVAGALYVVCAVYLYNRFRAHHHKVF
ncbi:hypothetical protein KW798_03430 [Candidatus Parcubacteria bacterium]|nr:hypothetical protein [Candidatus Parcubacteria bacterium]